MDQNKKMLQEIVILYNLKGTAHDITAINVLKFVHSNIKYISDSVQYKTSEYWAGPGETMASKKGDCEDGAILIYCLCRAADVPANQIFINAGVVQGGGHAWVRYISQNYPYVQFYLDWCYWYNKAIIRQRNSFFEEKGKIEFPKPSKYYHLWFTANEEKSTKY